MNRPAGDVRRENVKKKGRNLIKQRCCGVMFFEVISRGPGMVSAG